MDYRWIESPLGPVLLAGRGETLAWLNLPRPAAGWHPPPGWRKTPWALRAARHQLAEYFVGRRQVFELDLDPAGTPFQRRVWDVVQRIPYGRTWSYGQLAAALGKPGAARGRLRQRPQLDRDRDSLPSRDRR